MLQLGDGERVFVVIAAAVLPHPGEVLARRLGAAGLQVGVARVRVHFRPLPVVFRGIGEALRVDLPLQERQHASGPGLRIDGGRGHVVIKNGSEQKVTLQGGEKTLDRVTTSVSDNTLSIGRKGNADRSIDVTIVVHSLAGVDVEGPVSVKLEDVRAGSLELRKDGAGQLSASGQTDNLTATLSGVGNLALSDLTAKRANVRVNGVGHASVNVTDDLTATVNGVGGIEYHGNPSVHPSLNCVGTIRRAGS